MYGGLLSVKGMIELINAEIDGTSKNIIITGGFGKLISEKINIKHTYIELLTIEGMLQFSLKIKNIKNHQMDFVQH